MEIRAFPADALIIATRRLRADLRPLDQVDGLQRQRGQPRVPGRGRYANGEFIQVHPTAIPGADKLRLMSESARGEGGRIWVPRRPQDPRPPQRHSRNRALLFPRRALSDNTATCVPRDIATREIFKVCIQEGLSVEQDRMCVYLDVSHLPRDLLDRKLAGILEIYQKFQGVDPRTTADEDLSRRPLLRWAGCGAITSGRPTAGWPIGSPRNQQTNIPGAVRHRRVRLPVPRRQPAGGQFAGGLHFQRADRGPGRRWRTSKTCRGGTAAEQPSSLFDQAGYKHRPTTRPCWPGRTAGRILTRCTRNWAG